LPKPEPVAVEISKPLGAVITIGAVRLLPAAENVVVPEAVPYVVLTALRVPLVDINGVLGDTLPLAVTLLLALPPLILMVSLE